MISDQKNQKFFINAQTAKMADFIFQNMAYRATVYRTGVRSVNWSRVMVCSSKLSYEKEEMCVEVHKKEHFVNYEILVVLMSQMY